MPNDLQHAIRQIAEGIPLTADETALAFGTVMRGEATAPQIAALLVGLRARGETADELAGAARALRTAMLPVEPGAGSPVVDTCGTGGGRIGTFNLSTAAGFVVAAAGVRVAKHGNRSYTSKCGSADVLEALGVDIGVTAERAARVLHEAGLVFLFAPLYHPAMRHVAPIRKELGVSTIMNLMGPLANPAGVTRQVIGVADRRRAPLVAEGLVRLGAEHAMVVHGEIGMDELSPTGATLVWEVREGRVLVWVLDPAEVGLAWDSVADLAGGDPAENARRIETLFEGAGEGRDEAGFRAVALNAAAGIYVSGLASTFAEAVERAREALDSGASAEVLERLRAAAPAAGA